MSDTFCNNLMVDIETLGTSTNAAIVSIGSCMFNLKTGVTDNHFYNRISIESNLKWMRTIDTETLKWWFNQSKEAQLDIVIAPDSINDVLSDFIKYLHNVEANIREDFTIWGNGISFDLGILKNALNQWGESKPWPYWAERDVRTLVSFNPSIKEKTPFEGTPHHALHDCLHQVKYCSAIYNSLSVHSPIPLI